MSIRYQVAGLLLILSIVLVATTYGVQTGIVMPTFSELERQGAVRDVARCVDALQRDIEALSNTANDWGSWDDSYQYVHDHNPTYAKANLIDEAFSNTHINLICLLDSNHRIVWGEAREMDTLELIRVPDLFEKLSTPGSPLTTHQHTDDAKQGIVLTSNGPILLAARPIITTKREGPIRGSVVMGRFLSPEEIASLADRTHLQLDLWTLNSGSLPPETKPIIETCSSSDKPHLEQIDKSTLFAYTVLKDMFGAPAVLLRVRIPRDVTAQGRVSAHVATMCSIAGGVLTLFAVWCVLQWRIIGPLRSMAAHAVRVGKQDDLKARLTLKRADEIGTLAQEFDGMVASLAESRKKVLDSAHRAGMAEIASEVLHNVGNAVNSANCSVELLSEQLANSKVTGLERATKLLSEQAPRAADFFGSDPRGLKLIDYLIGLNGALHQEHSDAAAEVARLRNTIRHIRESIAAQQTFAGRSDFRQEVELPALLDEILEINRSLIRTAEVQVVVDAPPLPELMLNKSKITQVLVNLVRNAVQAMQDKPSDERRLTITVRAVEDDSIEIEVSDTGSGFDDTVREKLFTHGFTTKLEGNGFGLHYCANAVREAGGHISAQSPGSGQGATFRFRLPHVLPQNSPST